MLRIIQWVFKPETVSMILKLKQTEILRKGDRVAVFMFIRFFF